MTPPLKIENPALYADRTMQDWHRRAFGERDKAIDVDLLGYCPEPTCYQPLYLIESTTYWQKPTGVVSCLAQRAGARALLIVHNNGHVVGGEQVWPRTPAIGRLTEVELRERLRGIRAAHHQEVHP